MKNSKLITLLKTFSREEMKSFGKFIDSPYFNSGRNLKPLYTILKKSYPEFKRELLTDEKIYSKLNPKEKFDSKKTSSYLRVLYSDMTKLAKKFIVHDKLEKEESAFEFNYSLAASLKNRKLFKDSLDLYKKNLYVLDSGNFDSLYYVNRLSVNSNIVSVLADLRCETEGGKYDGNNILYLYAFMFEFVNRYINDAFARRYNYNIEVKGFDMIKSFVAGFKIELFDKECNDDEYGTKNVILCNYNLLKSRIDENDKESLLEAFNLYCKFFSMASFDTKKLYFEMLFNRLIGRASLDKIYSEKLGELIDLYIINELWREEKDSYLGIRIYDIGLNIKAFLYGSKEMKKYIDLNIGKLSPKYRDDFNTYSMAFVYFMEKKFDICMEFTSRKDSLNNFFKLTKYRLRICSLYELKHYEDVLYTADAFERFIRRKNDLGPSLCQSAITFNTAVKNLVKLSLNRKDKNINPEKTKHYSKSTLFGNWLCEKIDELKLT